MNQLLELIGNSFTFKENLEASDLIYDKDDYQVPGRGIEYKRLNAFIRKNYKSGTGNALYICGQPGTGKSLTLLTLSKTLPRDKYKTVYINCYTIDIKKIYSEIYKSIKNLLNTKKNENESLQLIKNLIPNYNRKIILILDEIDIVVKNPAILNSLFELPFLKDSTLLLFGIANDLNLVDKSLSGLSQKGIEIEVLHFKPYREDQILSILKGRLENVYNMLDLTEEQRAIIFEDESLELIAKQISNSNSDIRKSFEVMRSLTTKKYQSFILNNISIEEMEIPTPIPTEDFMCSQDNSNQFIFTIDNVMDVMYSMFENQTTKTLKHFPAHSIVILFSAFNLKELNFLTLYDSYRLNCDIIQFNPLEKKDFKASLDCCTSNGFMTMINHREENKRTITIHYSKEDLVGAFQNTIIYADLLTDLIPKEESQSDNDDDEYDEDDEDDEDDY
ncbi:hypothetical protein DICPUDRAFT_78920 [Dictyostelium purpureum]|uniref:AAA+ ATPase domain-containing protein n=1 Tax=Dictyostelium purpureum TaxID=5786 RepID=F0ZL02_DICPU|nr:uncharacterized protein DICPUDRAFT_78920 [Dictyostelium purpureum]EGC35353.1 hypothetical protein DICPUDRAFT_78920 [Dictyostelium purpureum]|eukprot:XP_003288091.1 hypothetical protein DICPUDRAFT_78920 [Dictyostelium purpureum]